MSHQADLLDYQLTLPASHPSGPGQLTVTLENTHVQSSKFVHLAGIATRVDVHLGPSQLPSLRRKGPAPRLQNPAAQASSTPLLTVPSSLLYGSVMQLQTLRGGVLSDTPYFAVSEELLENVLPDGRFGNHHPAQTPYDDSLPAALGLHTAAMLQCPASVHRGNPQHHRVKHGHLYTASLNGCPTPAAAAAQQVAPLAWLPWAFTLCLLICTVTLTITSRQHRQGCKLDIDAAKTAVEPSSVKSNRPILDCTPTKDTGCSPFVPVMQAPVPHWPLDNAHLASCSSKIGSYKQKARPTCSKAITNMTSNMSGATKWQRNKNGRLLSLALDPDEHNS